MVGVPMDGGNTDADQQLALADRLRRWFRGEPGEVDIPLTKPVELKLEDGQVEQQIGVCCSGGGIRSAAFCLGALQVLREKGELAPDTVVSAVSGGSYIASSFVAVKNCSPDDTFGEGDPDVYAPGSPEEQHLRNNSTYMAPGAGGTARLLVRVLLGMATNLAIILLTLAVVAYPLAHLYDAIYGLGDLTGPDDPSSLPGVPPGILFAIFGLLLLGLGCTSGDLVWRIRRDNLRIALEAWSYRALFVAAALAIGLIALPALLIWSSRFNLNIDLGLIDFADHLSEIQSLLTVGSSAIILAILGAARTVIARRPTVFAMAAGSLAAPVLVLSTLIVLMLGALREGERDIVNPYSTLACAALLIAAWLWVDLTQWSLHPFYRRRLSTAFFTRRTRADGKLEAEEVSYNDSLFVPQLRDDPFHLVVCAAANVSTHGVVPPGRSATPFTFSNKAIGGPLLGSLVDEDSPAVGHEEDTFGERASRDLTLPSAVAMSGAAIAPSMGKKTKRPLTMLMALLNIRLGVWMANPRRLDDVMTKSRFWFGREGAPDKDRSRRRPTPLYLFREMLGLSGVDAQFLYISDGGHYDNLGLIELLRRGCTKIYCLDGGGDPMGTYRALGEAVALARSDLQVEVDIHPESSMLPDPDTRIAPANHVMGNVRYLTEDRSAGRYQGHIVYTRATITEDAPEDVLAYREKTRKFPYHSTMDQLFDDQKFEAYRALGSHCATQAHESMNESVAKSLKPERDRPTWPRPWSRL